MYSYMLMSAFGSKADPAWPKLMLFTRSGYGLVGQRNGNSRDFPDQQPCSGSRLFSKEIVEVSGWASSMKASRKRLKVPLVKTKPARNRSEAMLKLFEGPLVQVGWRMGCIYCLKLLRCERQ